MQPELYKICSQCGINKPLSEFHRQEQGYRNGVNNVCKICVSRNNKQRRDNLKNKAVLKYGGSCSNCGYDHIPSLHFHHPNGRHGDSPHTGERMHRELIDEPLRENIQLLCNSCHQAAHSIDAESELFFLKLVGMCLNSALSHKIGHMLKLSRMIRCLKK